MRRYLSRIYLLCILLVFAGFANAQKDIVISDSLAANAEKMNVKMEGQGFGKIWKFHFGDYGVASSKKGWTTETTKGNLFNTKTESKTTEKFSFIFTYKSNDSAKVNAANNISTQSLQEIELLARFSWGSNELVQGSRNFTAFITINGDTVDNWALLMNVTKAKDTAGNYEAFLTNGERKIFILPVGNTDKSNNAFSMNAAGYEFTENRQSLCAVQYRGGGAMAMNKNIVWINKNLDTKMKLILAAAMTAILQVKTSEMTN